MQEFIIKKTKNKGKGVFAGRYFKKGELLIHLKGKGLSDKEIAGLSQYHFDHMISIGKEVSVLMHSPEKYINHSCDPNTYFFERKFYALNDIKKGDELSHDYSICCVPEKDEWKMNCKCGSKICRKVVYGGFFKLPLKDKKRYIPILDSWFWDEYPRRLQMLEQAL